MTDPIFVLRSAADELLDALDETGDPRLLANVVFYNIWRRRSFPYRHAAEGQTVYWVDVQRRTIAAELRISAVFADSFDSLDTLDHYLHGVVGFDPATAFGYSPAEIGEGYFFAVSVDPVAHLNVSFDVDWSLVGGRGGWARMSTVRSSEHVTAGAKKALERLPPVGREPVVHSAPIPTGSVLLNDPMERAPRRPSAAAIREVTERAKGRCEMTGCSQPAEHLDHIYPWARGGNSEAVNLQWLCAAHNLEKSDSIPDTYEPSQLFYRFTTETYEGELFLCLPAGYEVQTEFSLYNVIVDGDVIVYWKRGTQEVRVELIDDKRDTVPRPNREIDRLRTTSIETSLIEAVRPVPAASLLKKIGQELEGFTLQFPVETAPSRVRL